MATVPSIRPMAAKLCRKPFDSPDWLFEIKHDGFRALAYIAEGKCQLRSRNGHRFAKFAELEDSLGSALRGRTAILDGEIVCLDGKGRSVLADLMQGTHSPYFYAFDLLWLDNEDWRQRPLLERKQQLLRLTERRKGRLLYVDHLLQHGTGLFEIACEWDLEGIIAKRKTSPYIATQKPSRTWLKIKNPNYSPGKGRKELFDGLRGVIETIQK
jgi:bifunctional non-homologous end joining protein LigD